MGFLDKFKKKEESIDFGSNLGLDLNQESGLHNEMSSPEQHSFAEATPSMSQPSSFSQAPNLTTIQYAQQQSSTQPGGEMSKDMQILSLKLDAIKSELDSMNQRLKNIEAIAEKEQHPAAKRWY